MRPPLTALCLLSMALAIGACTPTPTEPGDHCGPSSKRKPKGDITSINFEEFFLTHQSGKLLLVDARNPWFYQQGRIPGAINLHPNDALDAQLQKLLPKLEKAQREGSPIIVYCNGFGCHDARTVLRAVAALGYDCVKFGSGWKAWKKSGMAVESASQDGRDLSPQPAS